MASTFNQLDQFASSPVNRAYCYAELAISSLALAITVQTAYKASSTVATIVAVCGDCSLAPFLATQLVAGNGDSDNLLQATTTVVAEMATKVAGASVDVA